MEENKKFFAELEIVRFEDTDVITTSPCGMDGCGCNDDTLCACEEDNLPPCLGCDGDMSV